MNMNKICAGLMAALVGVCLSSCNSSMTTNTGGIRVIGGQGSLPAPPAATQSNTYLGTSTPGDIWTMQIDHTKNTFTATDVTNPSQTVSGTFSSAGSFLNFATTNPPNGSALGLEILSRAALLDPGGTNQHLIAFVQQGGCLNVTGTVKFQFVTLPSSGWAVGADTAYGTVQAATTGNTWNFSNLTQATLSGSPLDIGALLSPGTCSNSTITIPPSSTIKNRVTVGVGPSGLFVADEGSGGQGEAGVIQPSSALNTASVVSGNFAGFIYEPARTTGFALITLPAGFGGGSGTSMTGGTFPGSDVGNPDVTKPHNTDWTIDLGAQDSANPGLYKSATVKIGSAAAFRAVAVVGNPEGKFVIFVIGLDTVNISPMAIYLFQQ